MVQVHLRPITKDNLAACLALHVGDDQKQFVADNAQSLAQAYVGDTLVPLGIYPAAARGWADDVPVPMVGFTMYELEAGIGFIMRLMIDRDHQGRGYGRMAMIEVIRRLLLHPEVEAIATSYRHDNAAAARLYATLGFVPWDIPWAQNQDVERYLILPRQTLPS